PARRPPARIPRRGRSGGPPRPAANHGLAAPQRSPRGLPPPIPPKGSTASWDISFARRSDDDTSPAHARPSPRGRRRSKRGDQSVGAARNGVLVDAAPSAAPDARRQFSGGASPLEYDSRPSDSTMTAS